MTAYGNQHKRTLFRLGKCFPGIWLIGLFLFFSPAAVEAVYLDDIIVTRDDKALLLFFSLEDAFNEEMQKALAGGVETVFEFDIILYQPRRFWRDREIYRRTLSHRVKYDALKEEYTITRSWPSPQGIRTTRDVNEMKRQMTQIDAFPFVGLLQLQKGKHYQIRMKARLSERNLPFHLHYIFFFISMWNFETDWYVIDLQTSG